jgi:5-methylcytosine-specific restriction endonuclease McrA
MPTPSLKHTAVLVLNASFEPINICEARRALSLVYTGTARMVVEGDREARPGIPVPSVIRLVEYIRVPHRMHPLTRKGIFLRDHYRCQYCDKQLTGSDLTLDHVLPESRGGATSWDNLVACCKSCNRRKANMLPEECNPPMILARKPRPVTIHTSRILMREMGREEESWKKFLYYDNAA